MTQTWSDSWTPVPRSLDAFLANVDASKTKQLKVSNVPDTEMVQKVLAYAKEKLPEPAFNHSMRVFNYGTMLLENHHPYGLTPTPSLTTSLLLSSLLHDIGTVPAFISSTHLSFELFGAMHAYNLLLSPPVNAGKDEAELVAEVINRHQDLGDVGSVPAVLGLIYFATLLDNVGANAEFVHRESVVAVTGAYPRMGWTGCFAEVIRTELKLKPWAHTSVVEDFEEKVLGNNVMREFD